jgi:hypothetical protein
MKKRQSYKKAAATHKAIFADLVQKPEKGKPANLHLSMTDDEIEEAYCLLSKVVRSQMKREAALQRVRNRIAILLQEERRAEEEIRKGCT